MTHKDIYTKFMIEYDKANITSSYPSLTKYEVANLLDKAYLALIAKKVTGNNPRKAGFEVDVKSIHDLQPLVKTKKLNQYIDTTLAANERSYYLPTKVLYYINGLFINQKNNTNNIINKSINNVNLHLISHIDADKFRISEYNIPWIKTPVCFIEHHALHVLIDPLKTINNASVYITYIEKPNKFAPDSIYINDSDNSDDSGDTDYPDDSDDIIIPDLNKTIVWTYLDYDNTILAKYTNLIFGSVSNNYIPDNPIRDGYVFDKWVPSIPYIVGNKNMTFTATYTKIPSENEEDNENPIPPESGDDSGTDEDNKTEVRITVIIDSLDSDNNESNIEACGSVSGDGIYVVGSQCTLRATPKPEDDSYIYSFEGWYTNDLYVSNNNIYVFTVSQNATYKAVFLRTYKQQFEPEEPDQSDDYWIDLGLPSGTLWGKQYSKVTKFPTYFLRKKSLVDTVLKGMDNSNYDLPTSNQWNELKKYCQLSVVNNPGLYKTYRYTSKNGNYIEFMGFAGEDGLSYMFFTKNTTVTNGKIPLFSVDYNQFLYRDESNDRNCRVRPVKRKMSNVQSGIDENGNIIYTPINIADQDYYVSSTIIPEGSGTVTNTNKSYGFAYVLNVEAKPNDGYRFIRWEDGTTDANREINVINPIQLIATFAPIGSQDYYHVTIKPNNPDYGYVFFEYDNDVKVGTEIEIRVIPKNGYKFIGWSDGQPSTTIVTEGQAESRIFIVDKDINIIANFDRDVTT